MKHLVSRFVFLLGVVFALVSLDAQAVTIPTVPIGNPGNAADTRYDASGFGSVPYGYRIGKYEVTNAQYVEFLNVVDATGANALALYSSQMTSDSLGGINYVSSAADGSKYETKSGRENNPVAFVSWYDAVRFANWLHNGQGAGDTEDGAYTLLGSTPTPSNGNSITRNPGAKWFLPSEDEWYKAAYHKNDGVTGNYWDYPTSTDAEPYSAMPPGTDAPEPSNTANYFKSNGFTNGYDDGYAATGSTSLSSAENYFTDAGEYTFSISPYGTLDQGGNAREWNETLVSGSFRSIRGGAWSSSSGIFNRLHASNRFNGAPAVGSNGTGFRVATVIPEPSTLLLAALGLLVVFVRPRRPRE